jgi:hypothetical protein
MHTAARYSLALAGPMLVMLWFVETLADPVPGRIHRIAEDADYFVSSVTEAVKAIYGMPWPPGKKPPHRPVSKKVREVRRPLNLGGPINQTSTDEFHKVGPDSIINPCYACNTTEPPLPSFFSVSGGGGGSSGGGGTQDPTTPCMTALAGDGSCPTPCEPNDLLCDQNKEDTAAGALSPSLEKLLDHGAPGVGDPPHIGGFSGGGGGGGAGGSGTIPEPSTWVMLIFGFGLMAWMSRRSIARRASSSMD